MDVQRKSAVSSKSKGRRRTSSPGALAERAPASNGAQTGVVHLTAEYWPLARTGGLGEAVQGLATYQAAAGRQVSVFLPLYRTVRSTASDLERVGPPFTVPIGSRIEQGWLYRIPPAVSGEHAPQIFLIDNPEYFDRDGIYGADGSDYADNARRFAFFCMAALTLMPQVAPTAAVLHAHDWHAALAPVYLRNFFSGPYHAQLATVISAHNAGFQGHFPPETLVDLGLSPELYNPRVFEWYDRVNFLKGGLAFSDMAVTVSPTHARELCTAEGGFGLHDTFTAMGDRLVGILNGIDPVMWDPEHDALIAAPYGVEDTKGKAACKAALQRKWGLPEKPRAPLFGMSARLVSQKGLDLVIGADLLSLPEAQFVFLGAGELRYERVLAQLAVSAPERIAVEFNFTDKQEHRLLAGADALLMPSLYEPCGLTQMRAQRYGTVPVARRVGGLADSITDEVTGILFNEYTGGALRTALLKAIRLYHNSATWAKLMRHGMRQQFGWDVSAARYLDVYRRAQALATAR